MAAPPGTPIAIANRIQQAVAESLRNVDTAKGAHGLDVRDLVLSTPAEAARFMAEEERRWGAIIKRIGLQLD